MYVEKEIYFPVTKIAGFNGMNAFRKVGEFTVVVLHEQSKILLRKTNNTLIVSIVTLSSSGLANLTPGELTSTVVEITGTFITGPALTTSFTLTQENSTLFNPYPLTWYHMPVPLLVAHERVTLPKQVHVFGVGD